MSPVGWSCLGNIFYFFYLCSVISAFFLFTDCSLNCSRTYSRPPISCTMSVFVSLAMEFHEKLQSLAAKEGLKGRKVTRALESFSWNITILKVSYKHIHTQISLRVGALEHVLPLANCSSESAPFHFSRPPSSLFPSLHFPICSLRVRPTWWSMPKLKSKRTWSRFTMLLWLETSPGKAPEWEESTPKRNEVRTTKPQWLHGGPR